MERAEQPLFPLGASSALKFAYAIPAAQVEASAATKMARPPSRSGRGLTGENGAAQAGIIRGLIHDHIGGVRESILIARCAPRSIPCYCGVQCCSGHRPNYELNEALGFLVNWSVNELSGMVSHRDLRIEIILTYFGVKIERKGRTQRLDRHLAKAYQLTQEVVERHNVAIKGWLKNAEANAWTAAERVLGAVPGLIS